MQENSSNWFATTATGIGPPTEGSPTLRTANRQLHQSRTRTTSPNRNKRDRTQMKREQKSTKLIDSPPLITVRLQVQVSPAARLDGLWMSTSPAQGLPHQKRTILRERYRELIRQFTFQVSERTMACGRRSKLPRSAVGLSVPPSRSCQSVLPNIGTSHTLHDVLLHRDL